MATLVAVANSTKILRLGGRQPPTILSMRCRHHGGGEKVRVREGNLSYEIEPVRDPATLLLAHYRVSVLSTFGGEDKLLFEGKAATLDHAKILAEGALKRAEAQAASATKGAA